ncbi:MAG TPA: hypothetical protein DET40_01585 [Lentisphaeria bacterium]|nr:MAG: hypothetical protein A2X45_17135 [Lentisphaerae bacterium GWF2_50_93]HCE42225.1 hypothetical protein [Lentisphaeria bacterium]
MRFKNIVPNANNQGPAAGNISWVLAPKYKSNIKLFVHEHKLMELCFSRDIILMKGENRNCQKKEEK